MIAVSVVLQFLLLSLLNEINLFFLHLLSFITFISVFILDYYFTISLAIIRKRIHNRAIPAVSVVLQFLLFLHLCISLL